MRIFWLGMHKILVETELPRLRQLGYEVFNPPYLSSMVDQSANLLWNEKQPTTLPKHVFDKLSQYNFFYNPIEKEIADILNTYFDAVIVTISPTWLTEVLRVYKKKIIYRTYGQTYPLDSTLKSYNAHKLIFEHPDFWHVPHTALTMSDEHKWLRDREIVVPYCLPYDIYSIENQWSIDNSHLKEIMMTCPNIDNAYYKHKYDYLKKNFSENHFKYYGVQVSQLTDPQVVGTLERKEYLNRYLESAGYNYYFPESNVCYLPPIEMMVAGGPVIYTEGSLLHRYFKDKTPGLAKNVEEAKIKCKHLLDKDKNFIEEIIDSQKNVRNLYHPDYVWPQFDKVFRQLLDEKTHNVANKVIYTAEQPTKKRIYLLHHFPSQPIVFSDGFYSAYDGIPRVMRLFVKALLESTDYDIIVTARSEQLDNFYGFFSSKECLGRVQILIINENSPIEKIERKIHSLMIRIKNKIYKNVNLYHPAFTPIINLTNRSILLKIKRKISRFCVRGFNYLNRRLFQRNQAEIYIEKINNDKNCEGVIIPHYYLFPESMKLRKNIVLYLPDYIPHFFEKTGEFTDVNLKEITIGKKIAEKAKVIFTNSEFSKSYLPETRLEIDKAKIKVAYLPNLNMKEIGNAFSNQDEYDKNIEIIKEKIGENEFIFYPVQPRPNKNLTFLLQIFNELIKTKPDLKLVLTCYLFPNPPAEKLYYDLKLEDKVIFLPGISDVAIQWLYKKTACLCFTSLMEGNFPPQIFEALEYGAPIVSTNLPLITERLPNNLDLLLLCDQGDVTSFVNKTLYALEHRNLVLEKQTQVLDILNKQQSWQGFSTTIKSFFINLVPASREKIHE